jgi:hypothetical protein
MSAKEMTKEQLEAAFAKLSKDFTELDSKYNKTIQENTWLRTIVSRAEAILACLVSNGFAAPNSKL